MTFMTCGYNGGFVRDLRLRRMEIASTFTWCIIFMPHTVWGWVHTFCYFFCWIISNYLRLNLFQGYFKYHLNIFRTSNCKSLSVRNCKAQCLTKQVPRKCLNFRTRDRVYKRNTFIKQNCHLLCDLENVNLKPPLISKGQGGNTHLFLYMQSSQVSLKFI